MHSKKGKETEWMRVTKGKGSRRYFVEIAKRCGAALSAMTAGALNALFGGGGGLLVVPALEKGFDLEEKTAHATSVAVTLPLSALSAVIFSVNGVWEPFLGCVVSAGTIIGGSIGALLLKKIPKMLLKVIFCGVMIFAGVKYLG